MPAFGLRRAWLVLCLALALTSEAPAQDYPNRTIKMIVPTGAGGITDILARLVGKIMSEQLGQPVIIDNRSGAGGTIGTRAVAQAEPDGYTLLMVFPSHAANPALYASLPYDSEKDFAPISMVTKVSEILLVPNSSPAKSLKEFVDYARKEQLNYASVGVGSLAHLAAELFLTMAGVRMTHIPYRSVPQALRQCFQPALSVARYLPDASGAGDVSTPSPIVISTGVPPPAGTDQMWRRSISLALVQ